MSKIRTLNKILIWAVIIVSPILPMSSISASEIKDSQSLARSIENGFEESTQARLDSNSTLDDYLAFAALNNPGLKAAFYSWTAKLEKVPQMKSLPDPMLTFSYYIENVETRVGPQEWRIGIRQTLPWFGTLADKKNIALQTANAAYSQFEGTRLRLFYDVKKAYFDLYLLGREIQLTGEHIGLLAQWETVALTNYKNSLGQYPDIIKIQLERAKLDNKLTSLNEMKKPMVARLKAILNIPTPDDLPFPESLPDRRLNVSQDSLATLLVENNTEIKTLSYLIAKEKESIDLANKAYFPEFSIGVDYIQTGEALNPAIAESGKDPWIINAGINLPIWFGKNKAASKQARARFEASKNNKLQIENQLIFNLENTLFEYNDAVRKIVLYQNELIPKAEQSLNATYSAYQTGQVDFLSVVDTQRMLLDFQLDLEKEVVNKVKLAAEIELLIGANENKTF